MQSIACVRVRVRHATSSGGEREVASDVKGKRTRRRIGRWAGRRNVKRVRGFVLPAAPALHALRRVRVDVPAGHVAPASVRRRRRSVSRSARTPSVPIVIARLHGSRRRTHRAVACPPWSRGACAVSVLRPGSCVAEPRSRCSRPTMSYLSRSCLNVRRTWTFRRPPVRVVVVVARCRAASSIASRRRFAVVSWFIALR